MSSWVEGAKFVIEAIARGVEFAAALIIGIAALEATIKAALILLVEALRQAPRMRDG